MSTGATEAINIFYSYAQPDKKLRDELDKHFVIMRRRGQVRTWHDHGMVSGAEILEEIAASLAKADIILLLISPDFIASEYCYNVEMPQALKLHNEGKARAIPIMLRPVSLEGTPLNVLQVLPGGGKSIISHSDIGAAIAEVAKHIQIVIKYISQERERGAQKVGNPKTKEQWLDVADQHYRAAQYADSLTAYEQAIELGAKDVYVYKKIGLTHFFSKRYEEAVAAYEKALALDPSDPQLYHDKGNALSRLKRYHEAISVYDQAIALDPSYIWPYAAKANSLARQGRYREALKVCEEALQLDPLFSYANSVKGDALFNLGRYAEAVAAYEKCDPTSGSGHYWRGKALEKLGRTEEAKRAYARAREFGYEG